MNSSKIKDFFAEDAKPKWEGLRDFLLNQIKEGIYMPGKAIPSENYLAKATGFARNTIRQAINELEKDGMLLRIRGKGTFVAGGKDMNAHAVNPNELALYGVVVPQIGYNTYGILAKGFDEYANKFHHQMVVCDTGNDIHKQGDVIFQLLEQGIGGIALVSATSAPTPPHQIRYLQTHNIPVVLCHRNIEGVSAPLVGWDSRKVGRMAAQKILEMGHRNIAYIGMLKYIINEQQLDGVMDVYNQAGLHILPENIVFGQDQGSLEVIGTNEQQILNIINKKNRPTAIFCSDLYEAEKIYFLAVNHGVRIPEDMSLVTTADKGVNNYIASKVARIEKYEYQLGYKAAELMHKMQIGEMSITSDDVFNVELKFENGLTLSRCPD